MKRILTERFCLSVILLLFTAFSVNAQKGSDILDKASAALEKANGISASFALHFKGMEQGSESFEGTIQMKGDKFTLVTPDAYTWYDGKTQWVYRIRNEEVNISEPSGEELQYVNPTLLLRVYKKGFTASYKGESTASSGKTAYDIELTPKKKADIVKVLLQIEKISSMPSRITIEDKNGAQTTIQINEIKTGLNQPDTFFVFNSKEYPDAEVIDLREDGF